MEDIKGIKEQLNRIEQQNEEILRLLRPVHSHSEFVDDLKTACYNNRLLKSFMPVKQENNNLLIEDGELYDCEGE